MGGWGEPLAPPPGSTHFEHLGYIMMSETGVWSYSTLSDPDTIRGTYIRMSMATRQLTNYVSSGNLAPPLGEVREVRENTVHGKTYELCHESFGLARISTGQSGGDGNYFGSKVRHSSSVTLTVSRASLQKDLGSEWHYPKGDLLKIEMSAAQFTELLTSQGKGSGVPVTIRRVMNRLMPDVPPLPNIRELITEDVSDVLDEVGSHLDELETALEEAAPKLGKARSKGLLLRLQRARADITQSLPQVHADVVKACETTVADAEASIEASYGIIVRHLGEKVLSGELPVSLPDSPKIATRVIESSGVHGSSGEAQES